MSRERERDLIVWFHLIMSRRPFAENIVVLVVCVCVCVLIFFEGVYHKTQTAVLFDVPKPQSWGVRWSPKALRRLMLPNAAAMLSSFFSLWIVGGLFCFNQGDLLTSIFGGLLVAVPAPECVVS